MTDDQVKQTNEWDKERREIMRKVDSFASQFTHSKGVSATYIERQLNLIYFALGQISTGDLRQAAEDNS